MRAQAEGQFAANESFGQDVGYSRVREMGTSVRRLPDEWRIPRLVMGKWYLSRCLRRPTTLVALEVDLTVIQKAKKLSSGSPSLQK